VVCCAAAGAIETPNTMPITNAATSVIRLRVLDLEVIVVVSGISVFPSVRGPLRYRRAMIMTTFQTIV